MHTTRVQRGLRQEATGDRRRVGQGALQRGGEAGIALHGVMRLHRPRSAVCVPTMTQHCFGARHGRVQHRPLQQGRMEIMQKDDDHGKFAALRLMDTDRVAEGQLLDFLPDERDVSLRGAHHDLQGPRARPHHDPRIAIEHAEAIIILRHEDAVPDAQFPLRHVEPAVPPD